MTQHLMPSARISTALAVVACLLTASAASAEPFTIVVMPDTQTESTNKPQVKFPAMTKWIVDHRQELNVPFVAHMGDLVNWETPESIPAQFQYVNADAAMGLLDTAGIPYAITIGNHDTAAVGGVNPDGTACHCGGSAGPGDVHANLRNTTVFNEFFPLGRFVNLGGAYEAQKVDNTFHTFKAGGLDWLVITAELDPRQGALDWANQVVEAHPDHNVIYVTHNYLAPSGELAGPCGYGDLSPQKVWDGLLKRHRNIRFVLSGHLTETALRQTQGESGETVYQILTDYQNLGEGWLRTLEIDAEAKTVKSDVYSPHLDQHKTGETEQFTLSDVMLIPSAELVTPAGGAGGMSGAGGASGSGAGASSGGISGNATAPSLGGAGSPAGSSSAGAVATGGVSQSAVPSAGSNGLALLPPADSAPSGCGCRLATPAPRVPPLAALTALLLGLLLRRRNPSNSRPALADGARYGKLEGRNGTTGEDRDRRARPQGRGHPDDRDSDRS